MPPADGAPRHSDARSEAREQAVMLLYEAEQRGVPASVLLEERSVVSGELTTLLVRGVESNREGLDGTIARHSRGWTI